VTETAEQPTQQQENPLAEGLALRRTPDPCALVIFGASGDLTHKKIMPALYALAVRRLLPPRFAIVGVARTDGDDDAFRQDMQDAVKRHARDPFRQDTWEEFAAQLHWVTTDFADSGGEDKLHDLVEKLDEKEQLGGNRVF
jgi:glucose-6-phosphate 1-dehydrogenase